MAKPQQIVIKSQKAKLKQDQMHNLTPNAPLRNLST